MSGTAKVRLVRCPKCEKLLPEVNDFSVYQCGGCGAVLRAKKKGVDLDTFSEKSDEERIGDCEEKFSDRYEKRMNVSGRRMMDMSDGSESDVRSTISSSSRAERKRVLRDRAENIRTSFISSNKEEKWDVGSDSIQDKQSDEVHRARITKDFENMGIYHSSENGSRRLVDGRYEEDGFWRARRIGAEVEGHSKEMPSDPLCRNNVGDDREELLRKLDELKDRLSRQSGDLVDKGKEKIPLDMRIPPPQDHPYAYDNWYPERNRTNPQFKGPVYQYVEPPPPLMHRQEMFYPPRYAPSHVQGYRRGHAYTSGPYMDDGMVYMDTMEQHYPPPPPPHFSRHHPSCSCYQCRAKRQVSPPIMSITYSDKYSNIPIDMVPNYNHHIGSNPTPLRSQTHARWPSDVNSDVDGFILHRPPRVHLPSGGKNCRPIAGGAPFLTCHNCFELLLLPKKVVTKINNRKKLRCGGCSTVIACAVSDKSLVVSFDVEAQDSPIKVDNSRLDQARTAFSSGEYDNNSGFGFHFIDRSEAGQVLPRVTSTYTSEAEEDIESLTSARKDSGSADLSMEDKRPPPLAGEPDNVLLPNKGGNRLMRKESTATEIDLSSNEYSNTGTTFDSSEASRDGDHHKASRGAESFFAGLMKKSFKDSHRSKEQENAANVTVNGHLISDRSLKKAEKLAGPIQPGHYWYDFRAGFWGAIGGPCLGIIPPFIEEFNYPMPEQCAGGNTHVFVNGRELNQKDLNLLVSRGLPIERDRSYIVEITGRVLDEDTGQELESLGKLAPTVERMKRGFGMRAPKAVA